MLEQHKTNINLKKIATISGIIITMMIGFFMMPQQTQATCTDGTCSGPKTCYANEYSCAKSSCGAQCEINSDCTSLPRFVCSVAEGIVEYRTYTSCDTTTSCACVYTHVDNTNCTTTASYDSDGGVIYTSAGFVTDYAGCTAGETVCNTYTDYYDSCSGNVLTEYSASGTGNKDHTSAAYTCSNSDAWVSPTLYQLDGSNVLQRKKTQYTCATTTVNGHANTGYCSGADGWVDQTACGAGQYHEVTHTTIGCEDVGTGYYSPAANNLRSQCAAGRYGSTTTNSASTCNGACTAGYYCPAGSVSAAASACGGNGFYCPAGSGSATAVSSGYYSTGGTSTTRTGQTQCEAGNYCVSGVQTACPANKTSDAGSTSSSDCKWENGQSCSVDGDCYEGNCDADFDTSTKYCHATATSCADYTRGTPWERATGYELCSGDTYYKSCSSSVWGAQQNNPDTADDYCTAQGDSQGGYDLAAYCTSGASGGFTNPSCVACTGGHRATTAKNDCQTACAGSDDNCITGYYCNGSNDCVIKQDSGTSCTADNQCSSGNCDTDFGGSTKYCHATATSCASYASGTPWERANGYELCSGNSYYRSCSSSVWGAQSDNPDPANDYCTAQSDSQGGYNLADVCTSGASGGFAELGCNACTGGHRANVMKDGCLATCSTDSDCVTGYYCGGSDCTIKKSNGNSCTADNQCSSENCDTDFGTSTLYCHTTATSCADYSLGTPWEQVDGYELCSGNDYYKSCSSSVWGAQQNNPDSANDYCTAQGDSQGGYDAAATCASGLTGGFTNPGCVDCEGGHRATTAKDGCQTACAGSNSNCINGYYCNGSNDCISDPTPPVCGTWSPASGSVPWSTSSPQAFTLSESTDAASGINAAGGNCNAATNGSTCTVQISDMVGNTTDCTSPAAKIDTVAPTSSITALNTYNLASFTLVWSGNDATSGVATYDVQYKIGAGSWTDCKTNTALTSITFPSECTTPPTISNGDVIYFQSRGKDNATNTEIYLNESGDTSTTADTSAPTGGSFTINSDAAYSTSQTVNTLNITCPTDSWAPIQMAYGNTASPTNWTTCDSSVSSYDLGAGEGEKTVYMRFRDAGGNTTSDTTDTITLDTVEPTAAPTCSPGTSYFVSTTGTIACTSGAGGTVIRYTTDESAPSASSTIWEDQAFSATTILKVISCDAANNCYLTPNTYTYTKDNAAPTGGSFTINSDATYSTSQTVNTLNITCPTDSWTPIQMAYGNTASPTNWTTCASSVSSYDLGAGEGEKTVYMRFRDAGGNTTSDTTDTITLDTVEPTAAPTCSPGTSYFVSTTGTIACTSGDGGTVIRYTTDESAPSASSTIWEDQAFSATTILKVISCDAANNCYLTLNTYTYTKDDAGPTIDITNDASTSWTNSDTITVSPSDATSGVASTYYGFSNDATCDVSDTYGTAGTSFVVNTAHTDYVCFKSTDNATNTAYSTAIGPLKVEITAPTCGTWSPADGAVPWTNTAPQTFTLSSSTDATSGINTAGGNCDVNTHNNTCIVQISDNAGNTNNCTSPSSKIDLTEPSSGSATYTNGYQTGTGITVTVDRGSDNESGMSSTNSHYLLETATATLSNGNCGSFGSFSDAGVTETANATEYAYTGENGQCYKFRYQVQNNAGTSEYWTGTDITKIDSTAPTGLGSMTTIWKGDHYVGTSFTATGTTATDSISGIRGYRLCRSIDNATGCTAWIGSESPTMSVEVSGTDLPTNGAYRNYYWYVYDNAGNSNSASGVYVRLDQNGPVINDATVNSVSKYITETLRIYAITSDAASGSGNAAIYLGKYPYSTYGWDKVDNVSMTYGGTCIDTNNPITGCITDYAYYYYDWLIDEPSGTQLSVKIKATDALGNESLYTTEQDTALDSWSVSGCPAGQYLSGGNCINVGAGYYSPANDDSRYNCAAGYFGSSNNNSTSECNGQCTAGYYCPAGSDSAIENVCGGNGYYCPVGSGSANAVDSGHYSTGGTETTRTGQTECEAGNYCASGVKTGCLAGTYQPSTGQTSCLDSGAGYYVENANSATHTECGGNSYYCPNSANTNRTSVSSGYYSTGGTETTRTGQTECEAGNYCASGVKTACPTGYTSPSGSDAVEDCTLTTCSAGQWNSGSGCVDVGAGYYSLGGSTDRNQCAAGRYGSSTNNTASQCDGLCTADYYCPAGSTSATQNACPENKTSSSGSSSSDDCKWVNGQVCTLDSDCFEGNCDTDFNSATKYCHANASACINEISEDANTYKRCSNNDWYKVCTSGTWGTQQTNPYSANDYCTAQGDSQGGYYVAVTTCTNGISGGFVYPGCTSCGNGYRANATKDGCLTSCANDDDCVNNYECIANTCTRLGTITLNNYDTGQASGTGTISFITGSAIGTGGQIIVFFDDFSMDNILDLISHVDSLTASGANIDLASAALNNKIITLTTSEEIQTNQNVVLTLDNTVIDTNPTSAGQYGISLLTKNSSGAVLNSEIIMANISNQISINTIVPEWLVMNIDSTAIALNADPSINDGEDYSQKNVLTVKTNSANGYVIQAKLAGTKTQDSARLDNIGLDENSYILAGNPALTENLFGYFAYNSEVTKNRATLKTEGTGRAFGNTSSSLEIYNSDGNDYAGYGATTNEQKHTVYYGLNVDYETPSGDYGGTITYSVLPSF